MTSMRANTSVRRAGRRLFLGLALLLVTALGGCDLDVADPSVIKDETLNDPATLPALLNGVRGSFTYAVTGPIGGRGIFMAAALMTDEAVHSGTEAGIREFSDGRARNDLPELAELWAEASRSRWTAEDFVRRMEKLIAAAGESDEQLPTWYAYLTESLIWAGFSNRVLGENFCNVVVDAGPLQPPTAILQRAREQFSRARELAAARGLADLETLALAGRAQVNVLLNDWQAAAADAALVPTEFDYVTVAYYPSAREANGFRTWSLPPTNIMTVWGTPFLDWGRRSGTTTGDPRIRYTIPLTGTTPQRGMDNRRPFVQQLKYSASNVGISLAKGTEMRLIEAEAQLVGGDWQAALASIQAVRTYRNAAPSSMGLPTATATSAADTWTLLMRERGIELWLEGRRLGDLRRWAKVPGTVSSTVVREAVSGDAANDPRRNVLDVPGDFCLPVSQQELLSGTGPR